MEIAQTDEEVLTIKIKAITNQLPNFITTLNVSFGIIVIFIHICHEGENYRMIACLLILTSVFLDAIDGKLARFLKVESDMGKQLDSFADFASFGLAPMVILLTHENVRQGGLPIYLCALLYAASGAFRLARFNVGDFENFFFGLPITAAGFIMTLLNLFLHFRPMLNQGFSLVLIMIFICIISLFMISRIKIPRFFS